MKRLQTLALEQKEDARHGDATFPIQKYITSFIFPIGVFFYFRIWRFRLRLDKDLKNIIKTSREIQDRIKNESFII